jgi:hypothetical protein
MRQAVDSGFPADALEVPPMGLTERVWQATAVRTFFEGLEEHS